MLARFRKARSSHAMRHLIECRRAGVAQWLCGNTPHFGTGPWDLTGRRGDIRSGSGCIAQLELQSEVCALCKQPLTSVEKVLSAARFAYSFGPGSANVSRGAKGIQALATVHRHHVLRVAPAQNVSVPRCCRIGSGACQGSQCTWVTLAASRNNDFRLKISVKSQGRGQIVT